MSDAQDKAGKDDFHKERSRFLDAFATLEEALQKSPTAQKDQELSKQIKALQQVRNDLVHSQLRFAQIDGKLHAIAINTKEVLAVAKQGRLFKIDDFEELRSKIGQARKKLA